MILKEENDQRITEFSNIFNESSNNLNIYQNTLLKIYEKAISNEIEKINFLLFGGSNQGKKSLLLGCKLQQL